MLDDISFALRTVLRSPDRLRALIAAGPSMPLDIVRFLARIVPQAANALAGIREDALAIPDSPLRAQALASVDGKAYHVAGACILATFLTPAKAAAYVAIVAPLETIYDFLDNLCDRHPDVARAAYPVLHQAIADALDPGAAPRNYYASGPSGDDGGYLRNLVLRTQSALGQAPHLELLRAHFAEAARFYAEMQTFKHYPRGEREIACVEWYEAHRSRFSQIDWHEFVCACGSQFQVYGPLYAAFAERPGEIAATYDAYFPYVSALHVLLDSFIDQAEDAAHGELNFAAVYGGASALRSRVAFLRRAARERMSALGEPYRHRFVLEVMALFYLSHPKIAEQRLEREARALLRANGTP